MSSAADAGPDERYAEYTRTLVPYLRAEIEADHFLSPTHLFDRELVLIYLALHSQTDLDWANDRLATFSLDDQPRDWGDGKPDTADWNFTGIKLLRILKDFENAPALRDNAQDRIAQLLRNFPQPRVRHNRDNDRRAVWPGLHTENHDLILLTIGYFRAQLKDEDLYEYEQHLARSLAWRMRFGWLEANSPTYQTRYIEPLAILIDYAPNPAIREGAEALLNHVIAERSLFSVQGVLAGPQCRTRNRPTEPCRDRMLALLHIWLGTPLPISHTNEPYSDAYWLARSNFFPDPAVIALQRERSAPDAEPRWYRGMRTRRGGEYTEFRYFLSPHTAVGSMDWRGATRQQRYHNALLAHPSGEPVALWFVHTPDGEAADSRFGSNESIQWGAAMVTRGELGFTDGARDEKVGPWRVLHTPWAAAAIYPLPAGWKFTVVLDLRQGDVAVREAVEALSVPTWTDGAGITWTDRGGLAIRFDLEPDNRFHNLYLDGRKVVRIGGMLHDTPELKSWYGTGILDILPASGPSLRLTTEPLDRLLRQVAHPESSGVEENVHLSSPPERPEPESAQ